MFRKLKSSFSSGSKGSVKVRFDVTVESVTGLDGVQACRVVWARQSKVQVTRQTAVQQGVASWHEELSQIGTLDRDSKGNYLAKEYVLKLQCPDRSASGKFATVGKLGFDMAACVGAGTGKPQRRELRVPLGGKGAGRGVALLVLSVAATLVRTAGGDSDEEGAGAGIDDDDDTSLVSDDDVEDDEAVTTRPPANTSPIRKPTAEALRELAAKQHAATTTTAQVVATTLAQAPGTAPTPAPVSSQSETQANTAPDTVPGSAVGRPGIVVPGLEPGEAPHNLASPMPALGIAVKSDTFVPGGLAGMAAADSPVLREQAGEAIAGSSAAPPRAPAAACPTVPSAADVGADAVAAELSELRASLQAAEARAARLESDATAAAARASAELAATTARYEGRVAQLLAAVESRGGAGEVEQRLLAAEAEVGEAEALAGEAMALLEEAQAENVQLRAALDTAKADAGFAGAQAARERGAWEARLREAFRRVEDAVALAERAAEERDQAVATLKLLQDRESEQERVQAVDAATVAGGAAVAVVAATVVAGAAAASTAVDTVAVDTTAVDTTAAVSPPSQQHQISAAEPSAVALAARCAGLESELEAARRRIRGMEDALERAEAARAAAVAAAAEAAAGNDAERSSDVELVRAESSDGADRAAAADELDAARLELEFARGEAARLRGEVDVATREAAAAADVAARETAALRARCGELAREADAAREAAAAAKTVAAAAEGRARGAEAKLRLAATVGVGGVATAVAMEAGAAAQVSPAPSPLCAAPSPLAAAALARGGPLAAAVGSAPPAGNATTTSSPAPPTAAASAARQEQSGEALELLNSELTALTAAMAGLTAERDGLESRLRGVESEFAAQQASLALAQERVAAREAQLSALQELQAELLAGEGGGAGPLRRIPARAGEDGAETGVHDDGGEFEDVAAARELAAFSATELAGALASLADAQAERRELAAKLTELRGQVVALRAGDEGELRTRIESLERDLLAARARADVDALLRDEHDRLAADLVATKLIWAQGQESLVKLRRALAKSQEKSMSFASKLTRLETRLYAKVKSTMKDMRRSGAAGLGRG